MRRELTFFLAATVLFLLLTSLTTQGANFRTLKRGMSGDDVRQLQAFLATMPDIYPNGSVTGYFGSATERAAKRFQQKYGIQPVGIVGMQTRAKIRQLSSSTSTASGNTQNNQSSSFNFQSGGVNYEGSYSSGNYGSLPACQGNAYLNHTPTDPDSYTSISPLGQTSNSGHITPSDHMYINLVLENGGGQQGYGMITSKTANVYAPADASITHVEKQVHVLPQLGSNPITDYALTFSPCKDLFFYYYHVGTVSQKISDELAKNTPRNCSKNEQGSISNSTCGYNINLHVSAGELIGAAGGPGLSSFDFGGYDLRTPELGFLDKERSLTAGREQFLHTICPLDYYSDQNLKQILYSHVQNTKKNADGLPDCGVVMQDKAGTIQGNWFIGDPPVGQGAIQPFNTILSITHRNTDPSQGVVSIGGTISDISVNYFSSTSVGTHNVEPSLVTANGQIYCYDRSYGGGYYLFQLLDSNHLKAEFQSGTCPSTPQFSQPTIYQR